MSLSRSIPWYAPIGALVLLTTGGARAQEDVEPTLEEVTITGSRIARRDFVANSPVATLSRASLDATGATTIETALNQLPQFGLGGSSSSAGFFGTGLATVNLRGLGASRNLVLVDGHRVQPSTILQAVDVNTIPKALIENVEIISGGASAVYGSDAISGVVNIKTTPRFEGIRFDSQYTFLENGEDGETAELGVTLGSNFAQERGNAVLALSWTDREEVPFQSLEFFQQAQGGTDFRLPTGIYSPGRSPPSQTALDQVFAQYGAAPGRVPAGTRIGFNDDGTIFGASNGPLNYRGPSTLLFDTGTQLNNLNQFSIVQVPLERYAAFGRGTFELTPSVTAFARINYSTHETLTLAEAGNNAILIPVTNPFIPGDLRTLLASRANPTAPFTFDKRYQEAGPRTFNRDFDVYQLAAGLKGKASRFASTWEVFASRGSTELDETNEGAVLISSLTALVNAPDGGASLCAGGFNPFGLHPLSDPCRAFLVATPKSRTTIDQEIVEANLQGAVAELPAGTLRFATGLGYRRDSYGFTPDAALARGDVVGVFRTEASIGETDVREAYVELLAPLLSDLPLVRSLEVGVAYRFSDYDTAGGVDAYKADLNWKLTNVFGLRGGYQRAVRAPSVGELYVAPSVTIPGIGNVATGGGDPCNFASQARTGADAAAVRALCIAQGVPAAIVDTFDSLQNEVLATNIGNTALDPETADTYTFGLVFTTAPDRRLLSRLSLAIDYYDIQLEGAIAGITAPQSIPRCFNRDGSSNPAFAADNFFCSLITRDPVTGVFLDVNQPTLNVGAYQTSGIDLQANWGFGLGAGSVHVSTAVTYLESFRIQTQTGGAFAEFADTVGSPTANQPGTLPRWKALTTFGYDGIATGAGVRWRYIDAMRDASLATNPASTAPGVETWNVFDLFARRDLTEALHVNGGVNNVADREPPIVRGQPGTTEQSTYDIFGRTYYLALTAQF